jgi:hypothetical protein
MKFIKKLFKQEVKDWKGYDSIEKIVRDKITGEIFGDWTRRSIIVENGKYWFIDGKNKINLMELFNEKKGASKVYTYYTANTSPETHWEKPNCILASDDFNTVLIHQPLMI